VAEYKFCKCGARYTIDEYTSEEYIKDGLCDDCAFSKEYGVSYHTIERKKLKIKNWEDKRIAEQWKKRSEESMAKLMSKCNGVNYHN